MKPDESVQKALLDDFDVSRETLEKLEAFAELLVKWNQKINLVSPATIPDLWTRHILDSVQVLQLLPPEMSSFCDIGSGGGLPGLVLAIVASEKYAEMNVTMIEADQRKCAFLRTVSGQLALGVDVRAERIETAVPSDAQVVSARALAPLPKLVGLVSRHLSDGGRAFLMKGANVDAEIEVALASWQFDLQKHASKTNAEACILDISNIRPR
ncbi:MAG: 16S rRNA (guanine(527)-N(7))-methyltransferase RsmG [Pseudomonadota bacterium]